jgi:hypothetical protein
LKCSFPASNDADLTLDRPIASPYNARNEISGNSNVTQYYYFCSTGSDAGAALKQGRRRASGHGPLRAFFIGARGSMRPVSEKIMRPAEQDDERE